MRASFYYITFGLMMGVLWRSFFTIGFIEISAVVLGVVFVFGASVILGNYRDVSYLVLFALVMALGAVRAEFAFISHDLGKTFEEGDTVESMGKVVDEPEERDDYAVLYIETYTLEKTRVRVVVPLHPSFSYGDTVHLTGVIREPKEFETDTGRTFNYKGYLMKDNIHYQVQSADVVSLGKFDGNRLRALLLSLKMRWLASVNSLLPEPQASLAGGVTVGAKRSLGDEWLSAFRDTGIIHIVVLSGYNLTLIANSVVRITSSLPKGVGFGFGALGVVGFASMVGAGATVVRASIMAILGMLATFLYRPYVLLRALIIAGVLMVMWNPFVLVYDPGFQLSFLATAGLIFLAPYFEKVFSWVPEKFGLRAIIGATFATQLAVFPLLMFQMGRVSIVAPFVNILILPFVPLVMFVSFIAGLMEMMGIFLATPFAWVAHVFLSYMFLVVDLFNRLPFDAVNLPILPWWSLIMLYALFPLVYVYKNHPKVGGFSEE